MASMSSKFVGKVFRKSFQHVSKDIINYFPNHMAKGLEQMQKTLLNVDCIVEVHDARIPFSGRNSRFEDSLMIRPHLLVLNKMDLACEKNFPDIVSILKKKGIKKVLTTSCKENIDDTIKSKLLPAVIELVSEVDRYNRSNEESFNVLIIGIPNVGKSSLINALRRIHLNKGGKATPVGATPGVTRSVMEKIRVSDNPKVYIFDTPGIMLPNIDSMDVGMKLAVCASLKDHLVGTITVADYMLFTLNKLEYFDYVTHYGLDEPTDDIMYLLTFIAKQHNLIQRKKSSSGNYIFLPNFTRAAQIVLKDFRESRLGRVNLDLDLLKRQIDSGMHNREIVK